MKAAQIIAGLLVLTAAVACKPLTTSSAPAPDPERTPSFLVLSDQDRARYLPMAEAYLQKTRGVAASHFRLVPKGWSTEGDRLVVEAIYLPEGAVGQEHGGNSVQLHLDRLTGNVVVEVRQQADALATSTANAAALPAPAALPAVAQ